PATMSTRAWVQNPTGSMWKRTLVRPLYALVSLLPVFWPAVARPASAASERPSAARPDAAAPARVEVLKVTGLVDPVVADDISDAIAEGAREGADLVVLQVDSRGGVVSRARADVLAF